MAVLVVVMVHGLHVILTAIQIGPAVHKCEVKDGQSMLHQANLSGNSAQKHLWLMCDAPTRLQVGEIYGETPNATKQTQQQEAVGDIEHEVHASHTYILLKKMYWRDGEHGL